MSAATARKAALAYWGFAPKAAARASKGVDLQVHGECGTAGLDEAAAPLKRFAALVAREWPEHVGAVGGHARMPLLLLERLAGLAKGTDEKPGESSPDEAEAWARHLVDAERKCFLAVSEHRGARRVLLLNLDV